MLNIAIDLLFLGGACVRWHFPMAGFKIPLGNEWQHLRSSSSFIGCIRHYTADAPRHETHQVAHSAWFPARATSLRSASVRVRAFLVTVRPPDQPDGISPRLRSRLRFPLGCGAFQAQRPCVCRVRATHAEVPASPWRNDHAHDLSARTPARRDLITIKPVVWSG